MDPEVGGGGRPEQLEGARRHPIVQTALDIQRFLDVKIIAGSEAFAAGPTDANVGVVNGIPSISVGLGYGGDNHTLRDWSDIASTRIVAKQIVLLAAALTEK